MCDANIGKSNGSTINKSKSRNDLENKSVKNIHKYKSPSFKESGGSNIQFFKQDRYLIFEV